MPVIFWAVTMVLTQGTQLARSALPQAPTWPRRRRH